MHVFEKKITFVWLNPTKINFENMIYIVMYFLLSALKYNIFQNITVAVNIIESKKIYIINKRR